MATGKFSAGGEGRGGGEEPGKGLASHPGGDRNTPQNTQETD